MRKFLFMVIRCLYQIINTSKIYLIEHTYSIIQQLNYTISFQM